MKGSFKLREGILYKKFKRKLIIYSSEKGIIYTFNKMGEKLFLLLIEKGYPIDAVVNNIMKNYKVTKKRIMEDIKSFVSNLYSEGVIEVKSEDV